MRRKTYYTLLLAGIGLIAAVQFAPGQRRVPVTPEQIAKRIKIEKELQSIAVVDRKVMVPMRDGKADGGGHLSSKDTSKKYPIIFVADALQLQFLGRAHGAPRDMTTNSKPSNAAMPTS